MIVIFHGTCFSRYLSIMVLVTFLCKSYILVVDSHHLERFDPSKVRPSNAIGHQLPIDHFVGSKCCSTTTPYSNGDMGSSLRRLGCYSAIRFGYVYFRGKTKNRFKKMVAHTFGSKTQLLNLLTGYYPTIGKFFRRNGIPLFFPRKIFEWNSFRQ